MKKLTIAACVTALALSTTSCSLFTDDDSGKFGKNWMLTEWEQAGSDEVENYRAKKIFWAIQGPILEVLDRTPDSSTRHRGIVFHYEHKGDSLILTEPRRNIREQGDPLVEDVEELKPYGINKLREAYYVEELGSTTMVLRNEAVRLRFKSF